MGKVISKEIENCITEFNRTCYLEEILNWQGNPTNKQNKDMLVRRNIRLSMVIPEDIDTLVEGTKPDLPWAEDHFQERISGNPTNPGETFKWWPYHSNIQEDKSILNKIFSHTYQERYWPKKANPDTLNIIFDGPEQVVGNSLPRQGIRFQYGDLNNVINLLTINPTTRQAYLPIWFPEDTWAANNQERVPCSLGYYFYFERGYLHCNYTIRSCDLFRHFRNDIYLTARLLQHVAEKTYLKVGNLNMDIYNLHLFQNDVYIFNQKEKRLKNGTNNT